MAFFFRQSAPPQEIATLQEEIQEKDKTIAELRQKLNYVKEESVRFVCSLCIMRRAYPDANSSSI